MSENWKENIELWSCCGERYDEEFKDINEIPIAEGGLLLNFDKIFINLSDY